MITPLLALVTVMTNSVTFTATATGVEKGTPVEFMFATPATDHDYETMFLLDDRPEAIIKALEKSGISTGSPIDFGKGRLHPTGPFLKIEPSLDKYISLSNENGKFPEILYGGTLKNEAGSPLCETAAPNAFFAFFTCPQSPVLFDGQFNQGDVYGKYVAGVKIKKGEKRSFTLSWDGKSRIKELEFEFTAENSIQILNSIKDEAKKSPLSVKVSFSPDMTLSQAVMTANALAVVDSHRIKINGCKCGNLFYRAFLPLEAWKDRRQRLMQPIEHYLSADGNHEIKVIDEDWNAPGDDPKLTERKVELGKVDQYPKTDTCFIFANGPETKLSVIFDAMKKTGREFSNWYIYERK